MAEESYIVTLSSIACTDIYPRNRPWSFTNKLENVIKLDPNLRHEVALVNVYYPKEFYGIVEDDDDSSFEVILTKARYLGQVQTVYYVPLGKFYPENNVLSGDIPNMVGGINKSIKEAVISSLPEGRENEFIDKSGVLTYDYYRGRVYLNFVKGEGCTDEGDICSIRLKFGSRLGNILGYESGVEYTIFGAVEPGKAVREGSRLLSPFPPAQTSGVDFVIVYTDIVERTYFGGDKVNIIDIFNMTGSEVKGYHNSVYYPVASKTIDTISVRLADQRGRDIYFRGDANTVCVLHIRSVGNV